VVASGKVPGGTDFVEKTCAAAAAPPPAPPSNGCVSKKTCEDCPGQGAPHKRPEELSQDLLKGGGFVLSRGRVTALRSRTGSNRRVRRVAARCVPFLPQPPSDGLIPSHSPIQPPHNSRSPGVLRLKEGPRAGGYTPNKCGESDAGLGGASTAAACHGGADRARSHCRFVPRSSTSYQIR
jgi:hypothetical protein